MKLLENRIIRDGRIFDGGVLKVDSFLNHQIDVSFVSKLGEEFYRLYKDSGVDKILTIEASGIGIACLAAQWFDVPVVFAKKSHSSNQSKEVYTSKVVSYTHSTVYDVSVAKEHLSCNDNILIIDDFLAKGNALIGLIDIVKQSGASLVGCGIVIEKAFQSGGKQIRDQGIRVESLARIESMDSNGVRFCE